MIMTIIMIIIYDYFVFEPGFGQFRSQHVKVNCTPKC